MKGPTVKADFWHQLSDGRLQCDLCPRECALQEGQRGLCYVRARQGNQMVLTTYGLSSGYCVDPIEKKPLNHFLPGTPVLSFGTAGCNLSCKFCQNWDISKSREMETLSDSAPPELIAKAAKELGCQSVAFTYNDPVIFYEYARDVAQACHEQAIKTVAVTAGYISEQARPDFFRAIDAANVDLKGFSEHFYHRLCAGHLQPVLDTLVYLKKETSVWVEITVLLIPGENDSEAELNKMAQWIAENLGTDVPVHFSAFHPDYKLTEKSNTSLSSLIQARKIAMDHGLSYVYTGNVHHLPGDTTYCPGCGQELIVRDWYNLISYRLKGDCCVQCGHQIPGVFADEPGSWGAKRLPVKLSSFEP